MEHLLDAVEGGDTVLVKSGGGEYEARQKPLSGRDLAVITGIIYDKRALLRSKPTMIRANDTKDRLKELADKFTGIARQNSERQAKVVDEQ